MFKLAVSNTKDNISRFGLTALAVILSVAFLTATLILSDSMTGNSGDKIDEANVTLDAVARGDLISESGAANQVVADSRTGLPASVEQTIEGVPGVADAEAINTGFAKLISNGEAVGSDKLTDTGQTWISNPELNPFQIVEGSAPVAQNDIAIDQKAANDAGLVLGDSVQVLTGDGTIDATIVGIASYGEHEAAPAFRTTFFAADVAADLYGADSISRVAIEFDDGVEPLAVVAAANEATGSTAEVVSAKTFLDEEKDLVSSPFSFLSTFLLAFAGIATVVGISIIYNTFSIAIAQRRRELALLRAVGASERQVMSAVMTEAVFIGLASTAVGVAAGIGSVGGMRSIMDSLGLEFLEGETIITPITLIIAASVGVIVTLTSAWLPARKAAATPPIEALRDSAVESEEGSVLRTWIGLASLAIGVTGMVAAAATKEAVPLVAALGLLPGLVMSGPAIMNMVANLSSKLLSRAAGIEGSIAATNLQRNPRRAASTTLSLTLGVALVGFFAVLATTLSSSVSDDLEESITGNYVVASLTNSSATVDPALAGALADIEGVDAAPVAIAQGSANGEEATIGGINPATFPAAYDLQVLEGSLEGLVDGGVAVHDDPEVTAAALGETIEIQLKDGVIEAEVVALVDSSLGGFSAPTHFISKAALDTNQSGLLDTNVYLNIADGALAEVQPSVSDVPGALLETKSQFIDGSSTEIDDFRNFIYAMLGLTVIIAIVGITNTTSLSISERVKEIGLLQAVGTTQRGVRRVIRLEATLLAITGTIIGLIVAVGGGAALVQATAEDGGSTSLTIPWSTIGLIAIGSIIAGIAAAAYPAWRASKMEVLDAIAS